MVALLTAVTVLLVPEDAPAHAPHDDITHIVPSPEYATDKTILAIARDRLLRTTNAGASWREIVRGIDRHTPTRLAISPSDEQVVYLAMLGGGVYRSRDQGWTWERSNNLAAMNNIADLAVSPVSPNLVLAAGSSSGLYRTADGGQSWTAIAGFGRVTAAAFAASGRVVIGDSDGGIFVSDDGGVSWTASVGVISGDAITAIGSSPSPTSGAPVFAGTADGRLLRSTNVGTSFSPVGSGLPAEPVTAIATSSTYATDNLVWVSTWDVGVYRSNDGGAHFAEKTAGLTSEPQAETEGVAQFGTLAAARTAAGTQLVLVGGYDGFFKSDDLGDRWRELQTLTDYVVGLAVSPDYAHDATIIATTYVKGAYLSSDGGTTWRGSHVGLGHPDGNRYSPVLRLHNVQFSPNFASDGTIFSASWTDMLKSTDRGVSWTTIAVGGQPSGTLRQFVIALTPSYASDRTIYVGTRQGEIYRSTAGGGAGTWSRLSNIGNRVRSLVIGPDFQTEPVLYAGTTAGVFKSADGGTHWTATGPSGIATLAVSPGYASDGTVFAGTESGLWVTRNKGQSWTELSAAPLSATSHVEAVGVSPGTGNDRTVLVSVLGRGLFRSTDGGTTFAAAGASLFANSLLIADFSNPTSAPIQFSPAFATDRTVFAMAEKYILTSTDGGNAWQVHSLPPAFEFLKPPVIAAAPTVPTIVEGASGSQRTIQVPFDLSHPYRSQVTVRWRTIDVAGDPAIASSASGDYVAASGTLVFPAGATRRLAGVTVKGDGLDERNELIVISTSSPVNATIGGFWGLGFATITDDDPAQ